MQYGYSQFNGDNIRDLQNRNTQLIKSGTFVNHASFDSNLNGYKTQNSMFSNLHLQDQVIYQHYGFASVPLSGARNLVLGLSGQNTNNVIVATHDTRYLPNTLQAGEVSLHDYQGQSIELKQDQTININGEQTVVINIAGGTQITITQGQVHITGNVMIDGAVQVKGDVKSDGDVTASGISLKNHKHISGKEGAPTSAPQ